MGKLMTSAWEEGKLNGEYAHFTLSNETKRLVLNALDTPHTQIVQYSRNDSYKNSLFLRAGMEQMEEIRKLVLAGKDNKTSYNVIVKAEENVEFVVNDVRYGGARYVRRHMETKSLAHVYLLTPRDAKLADAQSYLSLETKSIIRKLGNPKIRLLSELVQLYKGTFEIVKRERRDLVEYQPDPDARGIRSQWARADSTAVEEDDDEVHYYVLLENLQPVGWQIHSGRELRNLMKAVVRSQEFGLSEEDSIYGLRANSKLIGQPGWVNLLDHVQAKLPEILTPERVHELTCVIRSGLYSNYYLSDVF
jgi:hypothetical protein